MNAPSKAGTPAPACVGRIPVTLLTGFLGAGKTTLLNRLVRHPSMSGAAVLVNELGEVGIDHHLVGDLGDAMVLLDSGCLCCSAHGGLVAALRQLCERSARRQIPPVRRVVIETTGLADPGPVIGTLMHEPFVSARYTCDGVVTVVDATHGLQQLDEHTEAVRQVALADRLLISKCDLASPGSRSALTRRLQTLNPIADQLEVRSGEVEPGALFGVGLYASGTAPAAEALPARYERLSLIPDSAHDARTTSFVVSFASSIPWYGFAAAMGRILHRHGSQLLRVKGLLDVAGEARPVAVHCVQHTAYPLVRLEQWPRQGPFADRKGRLVFIVRDLSATQQDAIRAALHDLPSDAAGLRLHAADRFLPTRCWIAHGPAAAGPLIEHDGWVVQKRRLGARRPLDVTA